jgi:hypothetical protein
MRAPMSHELTYVERPDADRFAYRSRHAGRIIGRLFGLPFIAFPAVLAYMTVFHRNPEFGRGNASAPAGLQILVVSFFLLIPLILGWIGVHFTLGVRGFDIDRNEGTIREYSGLIVPWRRTSRQIDEFRAIAIRPERGVKFSTVYALYLVAKDGKDLYIDAWDREEAEVEASRISRNLKFAIEP